MNILFTVCGRAGSKGLKNKNISLFLGYPLVYYTLSAIDLFIKDNKGKYGTIDLAVNTDSSKLFQLVSETNIDYIEVQRKQSLATDISSKIDVIRDTLKSAQYLQQIKYDYVIDLDITSPLRTVSNIEELIKKIENNKGLDVVFSVTTSRRNPYFNMVIKQGNLVKRAGSSNYIARQQAPEMYDMNASMYIYNSVFLLNNNTRNLFDGQVDFIEMKDTAVLDIDHEEDLELMQIVASYFYTKYEEYEEIKSNIPNILKGLINNKSG